MRRILLSLAGIILIVWVFYLGATWGPRPVDSAPRGVSDPESRELVIESEKLESEFEAIAAYREPTAEELDLLRRAFDLQREHNLAIRPSSDDRRRQEELEKRLAYFGAKEVHAKSVTAEEEGRRLMEEGEVAAAMDQIRVAYELQRDVNLRFGRSEFRDAVRESRLQQELSSLEMAPLHARSLKLEEDGDVAMEEFRWDEARQFLSEARQLQVRVNEASRRSNYYNTGRVQELARKIDSLQVGEMMSEVQELTAQARSAEEADQWEEAAQLFERAMVLQNQINRDHPQSAFVSRERAAELDTARQTALSAPQGKQLQAALTKVRGALSAGDFGEVGPNVEEARRLANVIFDRFPRSKYSDSEVRLELEFLAMADAALPEMQKSLREGLLPLPGIPGLQMSATPVTQRLFSRIMNANPSRNPGDDLPVDSVTRRQALEFCRRASWILAGPVQLPRKEHFAAALGDYDAERHAVLSWHSENSGGSSHPVTSGSPNPHGFRHLVGNLRIWLNDTGEEGSAWTGGTSYADEVPEEELFQLIGDNARAPTVGLRYVVGNEDR